MAEVAADRRFRGQLRLVTLLLWRIAETTDVEEALKVAQSRGMLDEGNVAFLRRCMELNVQLENGTLDPAEITMEDAMELQTCANRLNSADCA